MGEGRRHLRMIARYTGALYVAGSVATSSTKVLAQSCPVPSRRGRYLRGCRQMGSQIGGDGRAQIALGRRGGRGGGSYRNSAWVKEAMLTKLARPLTLLVLMLKATGGAAFEP